MDGQANLKMAQALMLVKLTSKIICLTQTKLETTSENV